MKLAKMLGLAAVAALVAMAFVGVSSASATIPYLCNAEALENCNEATTIYNPDPNQETGDQLKFSLQPGTEAELTGKFEVKCAVSQTTAELTQNPAAGQGEQILAQVKALTFEECKKGIAPCTVTVIQLPYSVHVEQAATDGDGVAWVGPQAGGQPGVEMTCGLQVCVFKANEIQSGEEVKDSLKFSVLGAEGGSPENRVKHVAEHVELKVTAGLPATCGETATWNASYEVTHKFVGQPGEEQTEVVADPPGWVTHD